MAFIRPVKIRFFPRLSRVSPCFMLWGFLFSVLLTASLVSLFFPCLFFECITTPNNNNNTEDDIKPSEGPEFFFDRIAHSSSPAYPTQTSSPRALHIHRRQNPKDRLDNDGFPHFGDDVPESRISKNVNVHGQPIQTVRLDDVLPFPMGTDNFPMGTDNEIPGVLAACAQPCMKKAVELNTDCEDSLDIECTCRPEVRAVIEAASDECCREACDDGTPEVYWRPCLHEDDPLHY
ncbi:hypothetical protein GE21DRAFT_4656 [Neurospora crassa]|uniref:CFEM domain-containing protein n=1 Tax=Neurospora crassa (strain ATCC 24698 / 74-OR23-1A / CBS 708.71 / DSM 1257 / FGSC 987) TaxID=367110 RepID=Q7RZM5_NEUCR|nr:hypothetical protein NCU00339 [Neurospora crassa OR74A]EAA28574.1 hypothetical protein NCU00339 [Neurospora crassa OR74A]KHE89554.1 hypothetical protein GE21DRAFT_4656 [Neurospora crassa]|eukprot:XP_957810.1 hypothetical protein NCU00339 [Neurospora crassa OR74A]